MALAEPQAGQDLAEALVEQDQRVQVAVARVENVRDIEAILVR